MVLGVLPPNSDVLLLLLFSPFKIAAENEVPRPPVPPALTSLALLAVFSLLLSLIMLGLP